MLKKLFIKIRKIFNPTKYYYVSEELPPLHKMVILYADNYPPVKGYLTEIKNFAEDTNDCYWIGVNGKTKGILFKLDFFEKYEFAVY